MLLNKSELINFIELRFMLDPGSGYRAFGRSGQQGGCEGCLESVAGERRGRRGRGLSSGDRYI